MKTIYIVLITAVLLVSTAAYTKYVFFPNIYSKEVANTPVLLNIEEEVRVEENVDEYNIQSVWGLGDRKSDVLSFDLLNREIPPRWSSKQIRFKYTYLEEFSEQTQGEVNSLLVGEYKWQRQLDSDGNIVLGGVMFQRDGVYQLHIHNGLSIAKRHYLFGDLLHSIHNSEEGLKGTQMQLGDLKLEAIWIKDTEILKDNTTPPGAELITSTCLETNGDRRLLTGWKVLRD